MDDCKHEKILEWGKDRPDQCVDCKEEMPLPYIDAVRVVLESIISLDRDKMYEASDNLECVIFGNLFSQAPTNPPTPFEQTVAKQLLEELE